MFLRLLRPVAPVAETRPLALADGRVVEVRWVRDARARRLRLIVSEKGARLTLPRGVSQRVADAFLLEHRNWLGEQLAKQDLTSREPLTRGGDHQLPLRGVDAGSESTADLWLPSCVCADDDHHRALQEIHQVGVEFWRGSEGELHGRTTLPG